MSAKIGGYGHAKVLIRVYSGLNIITKLIGTGRFASSSNDGHDVTSGSQRVATAKF